ncbi:MAG: hypothetical protein ABUS57_17350, partial [Pseudomonadota bacterium]
MKRKGLVVALAALALAGGLEAADARPRGRHVQGQVLTQHGTLGVDRSVQRDKGLRSRSTTVTGPNGGQVSGARSTAIDREAGTLDRAKDQTFRDGSTRNVDLGVTKTGDGQFTSERTITGRNGETRTQTGDFAVAKTADGRTVTGDINTPNAGQIDYSKTVARTENGRSVNAVSTFEDGTTRTRASSTACADGTCATEGALTRRNGNELTRAATRTKTDDGSVKSATTTFADGTTRNLDRDVSHEDGQVVI